MRPAVSVIVPVYKVEEYIERCARALFGQTMEDLEFIFVDDCTPDASMDILARVLDDYPQRRGQVTILRNDVNRGLPFTRRRGVEVATGDYIIHCDSDDWPEPDMYAKLYAKATAENLDMVICQSYHVYADHIELSRDKLDGKDMLGALIRQDILSHLWDKLVTRKAYDRGITFPRCNMSEDTATLIPLACNCDSFGCLHEPLYNYLCRNDGICRSGYDKEKILGMKENFDLVISCLESRGLARKYKAEIVSLKCCLKNNIQFFPREFYLSIYPEVNLALLFQTSIMLKDRLGHLSHLLGIHGVSRLFKKR